jgi:phosphoadenosine phosphosulfate reductase
MGREKGGGEMLKENTLFGETDKVQKAIDRLRAFEPEEGYYLAFSGGKDSVVIKALADMAGVTYDAHYSLTTVDPPELVRFIKDKHPDVEIVKPKLSMWKLIEKNGMPPTRLARYCCRILKETDGSGRVTVTGVRWAESANRKNRRHLVDIGERKGGIVLNDDNSESRRTVENCYRTRKTLINPIVDWTNEDVWEFIRKYNIPYCSLYDAGKERLGCIGCPMNTKREDDFLEYPTYKRAYIRAFDKMIARRNEKGLKTEWETGQECFDWWISGKMSDTDDPNQVSIEDYEAAT